MASGKVHNLGFTLVSTGDEGLTSDATAIGGNELASNLNKTLGGKNIVRASTDEMSGTQKRSGEEKAKVKVLDGYASAFVSDKDGFAAMGDAGIDLLKLESKNADVAFGFRADTGVNVGKQGVRACFLGFGGEVELKEGGGVKGVGFQVMGIKAKFNW